MICSNEKHRKRMMSVCHIEQFDVVNVYNKLTNCCLTWSSKSRWINENDTVMTELCVEYKHGTDHLIKNSRSESGRKRRRRHTTRSDECQRQHTPTRTHNVQTSGRKDRARAHTHTKARQTIDGWLCAHVLAAKWLCVCVFEHFRTCSRINKRAAGFM